MVFGLALVFALIFGLATMALGANGKPFILGKKNVATAVSTLVKKGAGPALSVKVGSGAPLAVNSSQRVTNLNADALDGKDFRDFTGDEVIDSNGPLPLQGTFTSKGGALFIFASGSGLRGTGTSLKEGSIGMNVLIDGGNAGRAEVFTNERNSHKAFVDEFAIIPPGLTVGEHTISLTEMYDQSACNTANELQVISCTDTDLNDHFKVTVLEIPTN